MGALSSGKANWTAVKGYQYTELIDTFLLVAEVVGKRIAARPDRESFSQVHGWLEQILGQTRACIESGDTYRFLINRTDDDEIAN